ncbi:MAG: hypothetical protein AAF750_11765 [Planctomycetota bacterium]
MPKIIIRSRLPWEERWTTPTLDQLWDAQKEHHKRVLPSFLEGTQAFDGLEQSLQWHGEAWMWTVEINFPEAELGGKAANQNAFAYIVPRPETPLVCIPLEEAFVEAVPMRRLNRFIRDGIKGAKQSINIHWAKWTPSAQTEVDHLLDLVKRRHKFLLAQQAS